MDKLEKILSEQALEEPGKTLDTRIDLLLSDTHEKATRRAITFRPWQMAAAATICVCIGFGLSRITQPTPIPNPETDDEAEAPFTTLYFIDSSSFEEIPLRSVEDGLFGGKTIEPVITLGERPGNSWEPEIVVIVNSENQGEVL